MLKDDQTFLKANHQVDNTEISITATIQFYNTLFRRIMFSLKMIQMNKNFYDPRAGPMVPQHKLEIWPGYVTAVQEFEGGIMLCCDIIHKVLRTQTAYELLKDIVNQKVPDMRAAA